MAVMVALLAGCAADTPTQVRSNNDEVIARIVAGAAGYESNGFAATINDLVTAGAGATVRRPGDATHTAIVVTASDSIFDPSSKSQMLSLSCERNRADEYSEWRMRYKIQFAGVKQVSRETMPAGPVEAVLYTDGTYRNRVLTVQGESRGYVRFDQVDPSGTGLSGEYIWKGSTVVLGEREERYNDVTVKFTWNRLKSVAGPGGEVQYIAGRSDVQVSANGPDGVIVRSGSLVFEGDRAILAIGGEKYLLNVRMGEYLRRA
jgi:hypothetical protein